jgi:hypothetical protein
MNFSEWRKSQRLREGLNLFNRPAHQITAKDFDKIVSVFVPYAKKYLKLKSTPKINFVKDPKFAHKIGAFGQINDKDNITIDILDRHPMDILRTLSHELAHLKQHENGKNGSGHVGSDTENESNVIAGILLRKFGAEHSELFELSSIKEEAKKKAKRVVKTDRDYEHYPMELT